jgi:hypothetical protein
MACTVSVEAHAACLCGFGRDGVCLTRSYWGTRNRALGIRHLTCTNGRALPVASSKILCSIPVALCINQIKCVGVPVARCQGYVPCQARGTPTHADTKPAHQKNLSQPVKPEHRNPATGKAPSHLTQHVFGRKSSIFPTWIFNSLLFN